MGTHLHEPPGVHPASNSSNPDIHQLKPVDIPKCCDPDPIPGEYIPFLNGECRVRVANSLALREISYQFVFDSYQRLGYTSEKSSGIQTDLDPDLLNMKGSPVHISKTIMNLISNAAEAMPDGGQITLKTEARFFDKSTAGIEGIEPGDYIVLSISDTGIGIEPDELERIFEPFYTKKEMGRSGTGLGMAVVWGSVKDHDGSIHVDSTPGVGTIFKIIFPATRQQMGADRAEAGIDNYSGNGERILVVDDVPEQREVASKILEALGYVVNVVDSGEEAIEYLSSQPTDLIILDMIMAAGRMDGLETYRRIIADHPGQKALITSGYSETRRVKQAQALGAGKYIRKPYTLEKIGTAVKKELSSTHLPTAAGGHGMAQSSAHIAI